MRIMLRTGVIAFGIGAAALVAGPASAEIPLEQAPAVEVVTPDATHAAPILGDGDAMCSQVTGSFGKDYKACM
ncbi:hypothetical protein HLB23_24855 [Nocardia uniformis]|uniref:Uncharacterized protein n=1 Tax=Nocardia uniformis TaxID=53432 RepID=A0A849C301_9NOCA|nr:hypothetical protein [Nocardia uniformis]NNH73052.1 hypothetical protein [Nocardia uniformis]